jgi:hypothetical protein
MLHMLCFLNKKPAAVKNSIAGEKFFQVISFTAKLGTERINEFKVPFTILPQGVH